MFTYEDSRDAFNIPYDIDILEEVFKVKGENEGEGEFKRRGLYNKNNKFFKSKSLGELIEEVEDEKEREYFRGEVKRLKGLYDALSETYQKGKAEGVGSESVWK